MYNQIKKLFCSSNVATGSHTSSSTKLGKQLTTNDNKVSKNNSIQVHGSIGLVVSYLTT